MKIMIEIPEEFICDYEADRFKDCFLRFIYDSKTGLMAGNYERETAEMLIKAFKDAKEVISCKDCKYGEYRDDFGDYECHSSGLGLVYDLEFFCADGKRKEDEAKVPANHGRWIVRKKFLCCSVCGNQIDIEDEQGYPSDCPYCGAKMDGNIEDNWYIP